MSVEAFTVDGKITIDTSQFQSSITKVTNKLTQLQEAFAKPINTRSYVNSFQGIKEEFNSLIKMVKEISSLMDTIINLPKIIEDMSKVKAELQAVKNDIANIKTETTAVSDSMIKVAESTTAVKESTVGWVAEIEKLYAEISGVVSLMSSEEFSAYVLEQQNSELGQINAKWREMQGLIEANTQFMKEIEVSGNNIARYFANETTILERNVALLEQEAELTNILVQKTKQTANGFNKISKELSRVSNFSKEIGTYFANEETILRNNLRIIQEQDRILADKLAKSERETQLAKEIADINKLDMDVRKATGSALSEIVSLTGLEAENILKVANSEKDVLAMIEQQVATEEERLMLLKEIDAVESATISKVKRSSGANAVKGNQLDSMSYLPRRIGSMALTMWGFNEIMDIYDKSMQNMNAIGQQKAYTDLMKTDNRYLEQTGQNVNDITSGVNKMNKAINETYKGGKSLQQMYQKVDMQSVGANAMDSAFKYGVQADKLDELTEVMAIYGSEFVRQGRSQEDSILAVNDALDGEYRRLKEVNIGKEELEEHGYEEGDTLSMIKALREIAEERGYDVVAQKVTNLSDAITVLEIRIAQDLVGAFRILEPILTEVANDFIYMLDTFEWAFSGVRDVWNKFTTELDKTFGVQNVQKFGGGLLKFVGWAITLGITFFAVYKIVRSLKGMLSGLFGILGKGTDDIAKTTGDVAKTGGTVEQTGGFKDNFMKQWGKLGSDLGKIARAFIDVAVIMVGAFLLIEEAMLLISGIGYTYDALKPQFESGIEFIKEYGLMIALLGGALLGLSYLVGKVPDSAMEQVGKGAYKVAMGMAIAMGLVAEAIGLLILPLGAIALVGGTVSFLGDNFTKGVEVIRGIGDALNYIASDDAIGWFIIGFVALSGILGFTADVLAVPLVIGIATTLGLVAEAIGLLILPLGAIALLGGTASALGEENIRKGADTIQMIGNCLKILEPTIRNLLLIDLEVFGVQLVDWGNQLISGKTGLRSLVDDILPNLITFVKDFNNLDTTDAESVDAETVQAVTQMATDIPPLFNAMQNLNNAMGTNNLLGNMWGAVGGGLSGKIGMGLSSKLTQLYNDVKDVMDFATKLSKIGSESSDTSAVTQTTDAITQLKAKLDLLTQTITFASTNVQNASKSLGSAIKVGFKDGSSGFNQDVISVLAKGISEVQNRYDTWHSGGEASAQKLADGFKTIGGKLKQSVIDEMGYALGELDNYQDDFYNKGAMLGQSLVDGFKSKKALDQNSPAKITKSIREELGYSMEALNDGRMLMYNGGVALGQALYSGYNSYGNLRTNVDVLANKGVTNEQLQATARNVQANNNNKGQVVKSFNPTVNIDMSNSTIIGVDDLDARIKASIDRAFVEYNSPNGAVGY